MKSAIRGRKGSPKVNRHCYPKYSPILHSVNLGRKPLDLLFAVHKIAAHPDVCFSMDTAVLLALAVDAASLLASIQTGGAGMLLPVH